MHTVDKTSCCPLIAGVLLLASVVNAQISAVTVLHTFANGGDGANPLAGVIIGDDGILYGTTCYGGANGVGAIYQFTPPTSVGGSWTETTLHSFNWSVDGGTPYAGLAQDRNGNLYGTAYQGGPLGAGTVFQLAPPARSNNSEGDAPWTYSVLYNFTGGSDGGEPFSGVLIGPGGELYGTTQYPAGSVWRLTPPATPGGAWTETTLYTFTGGADGKSPQDPYLHLQDGVIYGSTVYGGAYGNGAIYGLTSQGEGQPWKEEVLYSFTGGADGIRPVVSAIGLRGELYGTTADFSTSARGTVYELVPSKSAPYGWTYSLLYSFTGGADGAAPFSGVRISKKGDLIGTAEQGGFQISPCGGGCGVLFEVTRPSEPDGPWGEKVFYTFRNESDGSNPQGLIAIGDGVVYAVAAGNDQGTVIGNGALLMWSE